MTNFVKEDIRKFIYYCWRRKLSGKDAAMEINNALGDETTSERTCQRWMRQFEDDCVDFGDKEKCGRPQKDDDLEKKIEEALHEDRHATCRSLAAALGVSSCQTIHNHLKSMGKRYLSNKYNNIIIINFCLLETSNSMIIN
jgi:transposase